MLRCREEAFRRVCLCMWHMNALALQIDGKYFKHEITYLRFHLKMQQQQGNLRRIVNVMLSELDINCS